MRASIGDRIVIGGHHIGEPDRDAEVIGVGPDGGPPYTVRWEDSGHEALFFPGSDAVVQHFEHTDSTEQSCVEVKVDRGVTGGLRRGGAMKETRRAGPRVEMDDLVEEVCWRLVSDAPVARIGFVSDDGLQVLPVNFALMGHIVVFRTSDGSMLGALTSGAPVVVEVDGVDETRHTGWSVVIRGHVERLDRDLLPFIGNTVHPWAEGDKDRWYWVRPTTITGRAISRTAHEGELRLPYMALD